MNWFSRSLSPIIVFKQSFGFIPKTKPQIKLAYTTKDHEVAYANHDNNDGYFVKVQLTENVNKIILVAQFLSDIYAFPLFKDTWHYKKEEMKRAIKTYNRVVNVLEDLKIDFEEDETPGPTLQGMAREELRFIDPDRKRSTNIRSLEANKNVPGESDWRSSIYGNRYPVPQINISNTNGGIVNFHGLQT